MEYKRTGDMDTEQRIILGTFWIVSSIVSGYINSIREADLDDMIEEGILGLIYAVENYNPARKVPFEAYARVCVKGYVLKFIQNNRLIYVPKDKQQTAEKIRRLMEAEGASIESAAKKLKISTKSGLDAVISTLDVISLDTFNEEEIKASTVSPEEEWIASEMRLFFIAAVKELLSERDADIVLSGYGITKKKTTKELSEKYNLTEQRINQILKGSVKKLGDRARISGYGLEDNWDNN